MYICSDAILSVCPTLSFLYSVYKSVLYVYVCTENGSASRSVVSDSLRLHGLACQAPLSMGFSRQEHWSG